MLSADGRDETSSTGSLGSRRARRERPADRRRIPRHPRRRDPRSGRRGPRSEKAVAGNAAAEPFRWPAHDQDHDPRHRRAGVVGSSLKKMAEAPEAQAVVEEFLARQRAMYARGDLEAAEELLAENVVWHVPGTSPIAG